MRQQFWTSFGLYMSPVLSAEGEKVNWINYRTGEKNIFFRMHADNKNAVIAIELTHRDEVIRSLYFEQFVQFRNQFEEIMHETWNWQAQDLDETGKSISRIYMAKPGPSIFQRQDWPELISFFKPRLIALDAFWSSVKYAFENLR